ncbi:hypothetical protein BO70DRAFT_379304 [Aspergillus heteromorphus CBS 117.55]|uniref:Uncharacterized protein n=1 Tax=Aspergillus heteromorphus CBS 117.55 TaxID=1448321 RepID=A0A317WBD6_9EURO|nr:uncharacterized protein BO70DRAFT_379304 [Aspergillus heteromorphus CBS 117.55]PWY83509.1 hypothetical protein BO70DRAFT_379304 [Aspergillus heteromorphus CBS 117.55]
MSDLHLKEYCGLLKKSGMAVTPEHRAVVRLQYPPHLIEQAYKELPDVNGMPVQSWEICLLRKALRTLALRIVTGSFKDDPPRRAFLAVFLTFEPASGSANDEYLDLMWDISKLLADLERGIEMIFPVETQKCTEVFVDYPPCVYEPTWQA